MKRIITLFISLIFFAGISQADTHKTYYVRITTSYGDIVVKLYNETPIHRKNFVKLCKKGFYNKVLFHRVIKNFVIQAGDPTSVRALAGKQYGDKGPGYNLKAEIIPGLFHKRGALAAARESDPKNPYRESSGSQFYIVTGKVYNDKLLDIAQTKINQRNAANGIKETYSISEEQRDVYKTLGGIPHLDNQYTIFGEVIEGMDIVDRISVVKTDDTDRPMDDIRILKTKVYTKKE